MKFKGKINEKLAFVPENPESWGSCRERYVGKTVAVDLRMYRKNRSEEQNRYYWGAVIKYFEKETGTIKWDCHKILKAQSLKEIQIIEVAGKMIELVSIGSTATLKTTEFEDYLRESRNWLSLEFGIYIPLPHECPEDYNFNL